MDLESLNEQAVELYKNEEYEKAREIWQENSKSYHAESMYHLGCMYYEGVGVDVDHGKAFNIFLSCAENNDSSNRWARECLFNIGNAYYNGEGVEQNIKAAFDYYTKAADAGHVGCAFNVGYSFYAGSDAGDMFERDFDKAYKYLSIAADGGMSHAQLLLATLFLAGRGCNQDVDKAKYYLKLSAKQGNEQAVELLKKIGVDFDDTEEYDEEEYDEEAEDDIDIDEMKKHFKGVEEIGDISELADMEYVNIHNVDIVTGNKVYDESLDNLDFENMTNEEIEELAMNDNRIALYAVGKANLDGGDVEEGFKMLSRSAAYKYPPAMFELGMCYIGGIGVKKDAMTGMGYVVKAAKYKDIRANFTIVEFYKNSGNNEKVMETYHLLADELGNVDAQEWLGVAYQRGTYGVKDNEKAKHYLTLATQNGGDNVAFLNLGVYYIMNEATPEGYEKAVSVLTKAKEMGSEYASFYLGHIYKIRGENDKARVELEDSLSKGVKEAEMLLKDLK